MLDGHRDDCPDEGVIGAVAEQHATEEERFLVVGHAETCEHCRALLGELVRQGAGKAARLGAPGSHIGPFLVERTLGAGAMGVIVAAHDPDLDRQVAIKILRADLLAAGSPDELQARLVREAQAMAKVVHANVITVHQVGIFADQVYVVMEYMDGGTLRAWIRAKRRSWREVRDRFELAGRGLAAAHAAGLVHRDFKPENVLVASDGRLRVTDFGLVGLSASAGGASPTLDLCLTNHGAIIGTPRYMAAEQHDGKPADARADQFAFCVALYEALFGEAPFAGTTLADLATEVRAGRVREPSGGDCPAWLRRTILRGLRVDPAERYPDMLALLADLGRDRSRARRWAAAAAALALLVVGIVGWSVRGGPKLCEGSAAQLDGVWDASRRKALGERFAAAGAWTERSLEETQGRLDGYAQAWAAMHREACLATAVGEQSQAALDLRMGCLKRRRAELAALGTLLASADSALVQRSVQAIDQLTELSECADVARLAAPVPLPTGAAAGKAAEELRSVLALAKALGAAGQYREGLLLAAPAVVSARLLAYRPLEAEALYDRGRFRDSLGAIKEAEADLGAAVLAADAGRHDAMRLDAQIYLIYVLGVQQSRFDEGLAMSRSADAGLERWGQDDLRRARLATNVAMIFEAQGKLSAARERYQEALTLREHAATPNPSELASALNGLGNVALLSGNVKEAAAYHERGLAVAEAAYGPQHPKVAQIQGNLAQTRVDAGDFAGALALQRRALAIEEQTFGRDNRELTLTIANLANILDHQGDFAGARVQLLRALDIYQRAPGNDLLLAVLYERLSRVDLEQGKTEAGVAETLRALELRLRVLGPDHAAVARSYSFLGGLLLDSQKLTEALDALDRAQAIFEKALGPDVQDLGYVHLNAGLALAGLDRFPEGRARVLRAIAIFEKDVGTDVTAVDQAHNALGTVYLKEGRTREALASFEHALAGLEKSVGKDHVLLGGPLTGIGRARVGLGQPAAAIAPLERALTLREKNGAAPVELAETRFALARALWESRGDRSRARSLGRAAGEGFATASDGDRAELRTWMARHR